MTGGLDKFLAEDDHKRKRKQGKAKRIAQEGMLSEVSSDKEIDDTEGGQDKKPHEIRSSSQVPLRKAVAGHDRHAGTDHDLTDPFDDQLDDLIEGGYLDATNNVVRNEDHEEKDDERSEAVTRSLDTTKQRVPRDPERGLVGHGPLLPSNIEIGDETTSVVLLQVSYDGPRGKALCKFYDPATRQIRHWYDREGHKPYVLTRLSAEKVDEIGTISKSDEFLKVETITRYVALQGEDVEFSKIFATNPLAIGGGGPSSFRDILNDYPNGGPYEARIPYHLNYIYDFNLWPGDWYRAETGKLVSIDASFPEEEFKTLTETFEDANDETKEMLRYYRRAFFNKMPDVLRAAIDIEIRTDEGRFPDVKSALQPVISIGLVDTERRRVIYMLETEHVREEDLQDRKNMEDDDYSDVEVLFYTDEREMLEDFFDDAACYPILLTFNGDQFDLPYLMNRAKGLSVDSKRLPWVQKKLEVEAKFGVHIDLYRFFRQPSMRIYAFGGAYDNASLNEIATALLGEGKVKLDLSIQELDASKLIEYNIVDCDITLELTQFNDNLVMNLIFALMRITRMPMEDFTRGAVSAWIRNWFYAEHRRRNWLIPNKEELPGAGGSAETEAISDGKKFQGAIVIDPKPGIWWNVDVLDFASLYPSIIKIRNLSYETIRTSRDEDKDIQVPETSHWVSTKRVGIMALLIGFVRDMRVMWFKNRAKSKAVSEGIRIQSEVMQSSLKVLINASYGVMGSEVFAFYCLPVAESTTAFARDAIMTVKKKAEDMGLLVIYGDTDSIFIHEPSEEQIQELFAFAQDKLQMELGIDYNFRYCVLSTRKKNYFGITNRSKVIVKGLMGKKKSAPPLVRREFTKMLNLFTGVTNEEEFEEAKQAAVKLVRRLVKRFKSRRFKLDDLAITTTIGQALKNYKSWTQPVQAAAWRHIKGEDIGDGSGLTVSYVRVKPRKMLPSEQKKLKSLAIGAMGTSFSVLPVEHASINDVDVDKNVELVRSIFMQVMEAIDLTWNDVEGVKSISSFLG